MTDVTLHDGSSLALEVAGAGPTVLLPVDPCVAVGEQADAMRRWGVDPALGRSLVDGLSDVFRVVAFDYQGHLMRRPRPSALTPDAVAADLLAVADAAGADRFAFYGYSWLGLSGLQLAIRTDRLSALAVGGFPPVDGPYAAMLRVTTAAHEMAGRNPNGPQFAQRSTDGADDYDWSTVEVSMTEGQTRQFVTLYQALQGFDDRAVQAQIRCHRLCWAGARDSIPYGEGWGGVTVDIAGALAANRAELESCGWDVRMLAGLDHTQAMQPVHVLPVLRPWLASCLIP
jgi:pimeloyl-ACP methyl ester carboxylesterase